MKLEKVALTAVMGCDFALCSVATTSSHADSWSLTGPLLALPRIDVVSLYRHRKRMYPLWFSIEVPVSTGCRRQVTTCRSAWSQL